MGSERREITVQPVEKRVVQELGIWVSSSSGPENTAKLFS